MNEIQFIITQEYKIALCKRFGLNPNSITDDKVKELLVDLILEKERKW